MKRFLSQLTEFGGLLQTAPREPQYTLSPLRRASAAVRDGQRIVSSGEHVDHGREHVFYLGDDEASVIVAGEIQRDSEES